MDGIGGENRHGGVGLLIHPFLNPTLCVRLHAGRLSRFVGRKGWGTHGMVRDSKELAAAYIYLQCTTSYLIRHQESAKVWQP